MYDSILILIRNEEYLSHNLAHALHTSKKFVSFLKMAKG